VATAVGGSAPADPFVSRVADDQTTIYRPPRLPAL